MIKWLCNSNAYVILGLDTTQGVPHSRSNNITACLLVFSQLKKVTKNRALFIVLKRRFVAESNHLSFVSKTAANHPSTRQHKCHWNIQIERGKIDEKSRLGHEQVLLDVKFFFGLMSRLESGFLKQ